MRAQFFNYKILEVKPITDLHEFKDHRRLQVFYHKGCKCIKCGRKATQIALGEIRGQQHWDLYDDTFYPLTVDHTIPKSKGGPNTLENLEPMCYGCNQDKGNGEGINKNGKSGGGVYSCLNHFCKWPGKPNRKREDLRDLIEPQLGWVVYKRDGGKRLKNIYKELGIISVIGINPHTNRPAIQVEDKPGSWFHYCQVKRMK